MRCLAITTRQRQCGNEAVEGDLLCPLHLRVAADHDHDQHVDGHVDVAVTPLRILATHGKQDPLVATIFWAADHVHDWAGDENRMALAVALQLEANGGALPDLERLVVAGALPQWVIGYWHGQGAALTREEPAYVDTDSGLIEVIPARTLTPAQG